MGSLLLGLRKSFNDKEIMSRKKKNWVGLYLASELPDYAKTIWQENCQRCSEIENKLLPCPSLIMLCRLVIQQRSRSFLSVGDAEEEEEDTPVDTKIEDEL